MVFAQRQVSIHALTSDDHHNFLAHTHVNFVFSSIVGMYALRERRQHVTQEDFEFAIAKVCILLSDCIAIIARLLLGILGKPSLRTAISRLKRD